MCGDLFKALLTPIRVTHQLGPPGHHARGHTRPSTPQRSGQQGWIAGRPCKSDTCSSREKLANSSRGHIREGHDEAVGSSRPPRTPTNLVKRRRTAGLGRVKDRRRGYTLVEMCTTMMKFYWRTKIVSQQHITMIFFVSTWIIGDGSRAHWLLVTKLDIVTNIITEWYKISSQITHVPRLRTSASENRLYCQRQAYSPMCIWLCIWKPPV